MAEHTVKAFTEELDALTQEVARMGGLAETAVNDGLAAVDGIDYLTLTFNRRHRALDLGYAVETAESPSGPWLVETWEASAQTPLDESAEQVTLRHAIPAGTPRWFARVRVTMP